MKSLLIFFNSLRVTQGIIVFIIIFWGLFAFYVLADSPDNPVFYEGSDFQVCTGEPETISSGQGSTTLQWTFTSGGSSIQEFYWIQVDDDILNFASPEINTGEIVSSDNFHDINTDILTASTYYWRVGIKDNYGSWSPWATSTIPEPNNPPDYEEGSDFQVCTLSEGGCCDGFAGAPKLKWSFFSASGNSTQAAYWVIVDNNSNFSSLEDNSGEVLSSDDSYTPSLSQFDTYYWRLAVKDNYGTWIPWLDGDSFVAPLDCSYTPGDPPSDYPNLAEGSNIQLCTGSVDQPECYEGDFPNPILNWTTTGDSTQVSFWLQIDDNSNFSSLEYDSGEILTTNNSKQICSDALAFNTTYYWRITIKDSEGTWLDWAIADDSFTTADSCAPNDPTMGGIEDLADSCKAVRVGWTDNSDNEIGFDVEKSVDRAIWSVHCFLSYEITDSRSAETGVSRNCSGVVNPSTLYYFRVKAIGNSSDSSWAPDENGSEHTTSYCAPVLAAINDFNCDQVNLFWTQSGSGIDHYEVWRKKDSEDWVRVGDNIPASTLEYSDTGITSGSSYQYYIKAQTEGLNSNIKSVNPCPDLPVWHEVKPR